MLLVVVRQETVTRLVVPGVLGPAEIVSAEVELLDNSLRAHLAHRLAEHVEELRLDMKDFRGVLNVVLQLEGSQ